uniref:Uncharacterized protein n=1 Tax=Strigamia maritima TaxID=126957 RepID=T1JP40_STRMM
RHRLINESLKDELQTGVHALSIEINVILRINARDIQRVGSLMDVVRMGLTFSKPENLPMTPSCDEKLKRHAMCAYRSETTLTSGWLHSIALMSTSKP